MTTDNLDRLASLLRDQRSQPARSLRLIGPYQLYCEKRGVRPRVTAIDLGEVVEMLDQMFPGWDTCRPAVEDSGGEEGGP